MYAHLSQVFDYGNTAIEKRAIFYKRLFPLLDFGRDREGADLCTVVLTHHKLKDQGCRTLGLHEDTGEYKLEPREVQEKIKALWSEIVAKVNDLFEGELTDDDKLVYVNNVLKGKLLESDLLVQQASSNTKEQFANLPDLNTAMMNAIMDALAVHTTMSTQALASQRVRKGLRIFRWVRRNFMRRCTCGGMRHRLEGEALDQSAISESCVQAYSVEGSECPGIPAISTCGHQVRSFPPHEDIQNAEKS